MTLSLEDFVDNKITEKEFKSILTSLNHMMIHFLEIPNGIDIMWDVSNFYYYMKHIGIYHTIPSAFTKLIFTQSHSDNATCYGIKDRRISMFDLPQAFYELKNYLEANKYYFVNLESNPEVKET